MNNDNDNNKWSLKLMITKMVSVIAGLLKSNPWVRGLAVGGLIGGIVGVLIGGFDKLLASIAGGVLGLFAGFLLGLGCLTMYGIYLDKKFGHNWIEHMDSFVSKNKPINSSTQISELLLVSKQNADKYREKLKYEWNDAVKYNLDELG